MAKRNVQFTKPEEPSFLKQIKAQIGYKEPDTVETKVNFYLLFRNLMKNYIIEFIF